MKTIAIAGIVVTIAVVTLSGAGDKVEEIFSDTSVAANAMNVHQLRIALESYYLDHGAYPVAANSGELIDILLDDEHIENKPLDVDVIDYELISDGQDYELEVN